MLHVNVNIQILRNGKPVAGHRSVRVTNTLMPCNPLPQNQIGGNQALGYILKTRFHFGRDRLLVPK